MDFEIRLAMPSDVSAIAEHVCRAGGGLMEFLLDGVVPDVEPQQLLAVTLTNADEAISYKNALVAETEDGVEGLLLAYSFKEFLISSEMEVFVDREKLEHIRELYSHKIADSLYVHALSINDTLQGKGLGRLFLDLSCDLAREEGYESICLHVWRDNETAMQLYQKYGFKPVREIEIKRADLLPHDGGMILMAYDVTGK